VTERLIPKVAMSGEFWGFSKSSSSALTGAIQLHRIPVRDLCFVVPEVRRLFLRHQLSFYDNPVNAFTGE